MMKRDKKDEEAHMSVFANLDKTTVLQEARIFNETPINARKCSLVLTKLLYILGQGEVLGRTEATEAFFAVTKLWQSKDPTLRRLVYLAIKDLCDKADDVIIVTSSLTKDMTGREDMYRAAAIRALCKITDATMLQAIERYMKQAIVDKVPAVSSAALVSSLHLMQRRCTEVVKRWANEVQEAVNSDNHMVQFHALCVLYHIRRTDRLAVNKMVQKFTKQGLKSPLALCYLIRLATKLLDDGDSNIESSLFDFLESCMRHKSDIVIYEAASAITRLPNCTAKDLAPAISVLQLFCSSPKPSQRFAAVRTLSKISIAHPAAVAACNMDLEQLITDPNRSIATLAITTLLKTGAEASVERLMKQINSFVSEIPDEFKIVVIQAIRSLCTRYPRKHSVMLSFLSQMLRDDGGYEYKKAIVDTIMQIVDENSEAKDSGLNSLCEFIEDCEHPALATRVLHLLGRLAPLTPNPRRYVRYVYNRVILEAPQVRAAAVTTLAKIGAQVPQLRESMIVLLRRCTMDTDDEVRDRAAYYVHMLEMNDNTVNNDYIMNGLSVSLPGLERCLRDYCAPGAHQKQAFDLKSVPVAQQPISVLETKEKPPVAEAPVKKEEKPKGSLVDQYAERLRQVANFDKFGPLFRSSEPIELTESETEYVVHCVKHTFRRHLVLQFDVRNTLDDQLLDNVQVSIEPQDDDGRWKVLTTTAHNRLVGGEMATVYVALEIPSIADADDVAALTATMSAMLKFTARDCDPTTHEPDSDEGYEDEYQLEELELSVAEHMQKVQKANFAAAWADERPGIHQTEDTYALSTVNTIQEAVTNLVKVLGMGVCERSDRVPEGKLSHTLSMSSVYRSGDEVLVRARFVADLQTGVTMQLAVRSQSEEAIALIGSVFG